MNKNKIKVLLIEDNPSDALLLGETLKEDAFSTFEVTTAEQLSDGLKLFKKEQFQAVLLDLGLPDSQGLETFQKASKEITTVPILVLSGLLDDRIALEAVQASAQDFLIKSPSGWQQAARAIRYAIERQHGGETLRQSEEDFRHLFESESDAIFLVDQEKGVILRANKTAADLYGYSREELLALKYADLSAEPEKSRKDFAKTRLNQTNRLTIPLRYHRKKDGLVFPVEISGSILNHRGRPMQIAAIRDITERKLTEDALHLAEERLMTFLNVTSDMAFLKDPHFHHLYANQALADFLNRSIDEILAKTDFELMPEPEAQRCRETDEEALRTGKSLVSEEKVGERFFETIKFPVPIEKGRIGVGGFIRDVTERRKAEEALIQSEKKYRSLHESMRDGFANVSLDGKFIDCNEVFQRMVGYTRSELEHMTFNELTPEIWHEVEAKIIKDQVLERGYSDVYEKEYRRKDGSVFPIELQTILLRDDNGNPTQMWASVRDITERKRSELILKESEERFRGIFDGVQDAIFVEANDGSIIAANRYACELYGYSFEDLRKKNVNDLVPDEKMIIHFKHKFDSYQPVETFNKRANGEVFPIEISGKRQMLQGQEVLLVIVRDITERKKAENKIQQQLAELTQWHDMTIDREGRTLELKNEVNGLLEELGKPIRYPSAK